MLLGPLCGTMPYSSLIIKHVNNVKTSREEFTSPFIRLVSAPVTQSLLTYNYPEIIDIVILGINAVSPAKGHEMILTFNTLLVI